MSRVLAVFAHPDDESLLAGGTLAACAAAGFEVGIVSMTRGEAGPSAEPVSELGEVREAELRAAGGVLGVSWVTCLDFPDGRLAWVDEREAMEELARAAGDGFPDVVLTFGAEGLYWHPDHLAVHRFVNAVFAGEPRTHVFGATWPAPSVRDLLVALGARGLPTGLWEVDPGAFGIQDTSQARAVDVGAVALTKLAAIRSHRSQLGVGELFATIPDDLAEQFLGCEYLLPLNGDGTRGPDPLAGLLLTCV
jgi:LmbE family N-acetylglucosaminyl deacetylase